MKTKFTRALGAALTAAMVAVWPSTGQAWEPTKTVEFIVPAGIGGGAGQMAQLIQGIIQKHKLMPTSMVVISNRDARPNCDSLASEDIHKLSRTGLHDITEFMLSSSMLKAKVNA